MKLKYNTTFSVIFSWLNTTMTENRKVLNTNDLDGFDKVKIKLICDDLPLQHLDLLTEILFFTRCSSINSRERSLLLFCVNVVLAFLEIDDYCTTSFIYSGICFL
jgi:hypothetical protein